MRRMPLSDFALDPRLENDSTSIMVAGLCDIRLSKDALALADPGAAPGGYYRDLRTDAA